MGWLRRVGGLLVGLVVAGAATPAHGRTQTAATASGVLRVTVTIGSEGATTPVRRHALLVSDTPPSRAPWRFLTGADGTGKVTLPAGTYTVESEEPIAFSGRTYEWRQEVTITAGQDTVLVLTSANAEVGERAPDTTEAGANRVLDAWDLLLRWQDTVVRVWTPTRHASAVIVGPGLVATAQRVVGTDTTAQVQVSASEKVSARVVATDPGREVAILAVAPGVLKDRPELALGCDGPPATLERGDRVSALSLPLRGQPNTATGTVRRVKTGPLLAEFDYSLGSVGGPVFSAGGVLIGLTSLAEGGGDDAHIETPIVSRAAVCEAVASARTATVETAPTLLPVEPDAYVTEADLKQAIEKKRGGLAPYQVSTAGFDVSVVTPLAAHAGAQGSFDFGQWSAYVANYPSVLLVRATPRQVESLWLKVARGAAMTQGIALPPLTHFAPGFARMRVLCGAKELVPVHPFVVERRTSETEAIREGMYVFTPDAIGPHCGSVTIEVWSEKAPDKREVVTLDAPRLTQIWNDMAPFRASAR
ncbi:hypothetical protein TBR22_A47710 [Luteitalea sp. TBR-22]|uniref:S1 family peptidase n=1 Tax=Luteitalea sp. TBR-22 TaxID=2802971 RepID=UPI001AF4728C|nr:serine protease [Luteitalea sp. TBR-22]BCS35538.1 hypothetical protein TBR22_A47710 [Luteitalea sp. TBR-22]